jgi:hypothetical protein
LTIHAPLIGAFEVRRPFPARLGPKGALFYKLVTSIDHKMIGIMYVVAFRVLPHRRADGTIHARGIGTRGSVCPTGANIRVGIEVTAIRPAANR